MKNYSRMTKRWLVLIAGLFFESLGVALSIQAHMGVTPISSIPYVLNLRFTHVTIGQWTLAYNMLFILIQLILLNRNFQKKHWIQIPLLLIFSFFLDLLDRLLGTITLSGYGESLLFIILGTASLAWGITLCCKADICLNTGEAIVNALKIVSKKEFGKVKVLFDSTLVVLTIITSLIFFRAIHGIREGTLIMAVFTGILVHLFTKLTSRIPA